MGKQMELERKKDSQHANVKRVKELCGALLEDGNAPPCLLSLMRWLDLESDRSAPRLHHRHGPLWEPFEEQRALRNKGKDEPIRLRPRGDAPLREGSDFPKISPAVADQLFKTAQIAEMQLTEVKQQKSLEMQRARPLLARARETATASLQSLRAEKSASLASHHAAAKGSTEDGDVFDAYGWVLDSHEHRLAENVARKVPSLASRTGSASPTRTTFPQSARSSSSGSRPSPKADVARKVAKQQAFQNTLAASPQHSRRSVQSQGGLSDFSENESQARREWRTDRSPSQSSMGSAISERRVSRMSSRLSRRQRLGDYVKLDLQPREPGWLTKYAEERLREEEKELTERSARGADNTISLL